MVSLPKLTGPTTRRAEAERFLRLSIAIREKLTHIDHGSNLKTHPAPLSRFETFAHNVVFSLFVLIVFSLGKVFRILSFFE